MMAITEDPANDSDRAARSILGFDNQKFPSTVLSVRSSNQNSAYRHSEMAAISYREPIRHRALQSYESPSAGPEHYFRAKWPPPI